MSEHIKKIRVMVVDDSALMRKMMSGMLEKDPDIEVVNTAMDGLFALSKIPKSRPDVITLDLDMPRMDGLTALRRIVDEYRLPVVLVSSHTTQGGDLTLKGLSLGAVDFVTKPQEAISTHINDIAEELIGKVKIASRARVGKILNRPQPAVPRKHIVYNKQPEGGDSENVVAIGVSTGGPNAISYLLPMLQEDFPASILIVQHMPEGFTGMFADRLNQISRLTIKEARDGDRLVNGAAFIAPGNRHMKVARIGEEGVVVLSCAAPVNGHRPSVDVLFDSVSKEYGSGVIGVIMTGMGVDGARGLGMIKDAGGHTMAQDEESSVVFGMPRAAIEMGNAQEVVSLDQLPERLTARLKEVSADAGGAVQAV